MAKAAKVAIVEAENIVEVGSIDPDDVDLPGIFVDRIVPATVGKKIENIKLTESTSETESLEKPKTPAQAKRNRIARRAAKELKNGFYVNLGVG
jgi:3-oxoacid CoA-transferase